MGRSAGLYLIIFFIPYLFALPFSTGADDSAPSQQHSQIKLDPNKAVVSVNGISILARDLIRKLEDRIPQTGHGTISNERLAQLRGEILEGLIIEEVLVQEARKEKVRVSKKDIRAEVRLIEDRFPSPEAYNEALLKRGMSEETIRAGVERHLLIRRLTEKQGHSQVKISNKDMETYYKDHKEQFVLPEQIRLRIILVPVTPESTKDQWLEARGKTEEIVEKARGGEDFKNLVRDYSGDDRIPAERLGDTGLLHQGRLPYKELETVVFEEEVGSVGGPVQSLYGYLVYRVEEKKLSQQLPFDKVNKKLLEKEMRESEAQKRLKEWIEGLREKADIKFLEPSP